NQAGPGNPTCDPECRARLELDLQAPQCRRPVTYLWLEAGRLQSHRLRAAPWPRRRGPVFADELVPLPGAHPIGDPFMKIAWSYNCLYARTPHILSDRVAHAHESNGDPSGL